MKTAMRGRSMPPSFDLPRIEQKSRNNPFIVGSDNKGFVAPES